MTTAAVDGGAELQYGAGRGEDAEKQDGLAAENALGMAAESILALSGMALTVATEGDDVKEVLTPEKS